MNKFALVISLSAATFGSIRTIASEIPAINDSAIGSDICDNRKSNELRGHCLHSADQG
jgi:hypothetical protein